MRNGTYWSAGGVKASIDLALAIATELVDAEFAQSGNLAIKYAPAPPLDAGRLESAPPAVLRRMRERMQAMGAQRAAAVQRAAARLHALAG